MHFLCRQIRNQRYPQNDRPLIMKILTHQNRRSPLGRFLRMGTVPQRGHKVEDHLQNHPLVRRSMGLRNQISGNINLSYIVLKKCFHQPCSSKRINTINNLTSSVPLLTTRNKFFLFYLHQSSYNVGVLHGPESSS